jgi:hypothetical protein
MASGWLATALIVIQNRGYGLASIKIPPGAVGYWVLLNLHGLAEK